jgi:hypothetical protein
MRYVRAALLATAAIGLMAVAAPASAQQIIQGPDGHYYKLIPVRTPVVTGIPAQATASVINTSSCRLTNFQNGEYQPEYTTVCGPE